MDLAERLGWRFVRYSGGGCHMLLQHIGTASIPATGRFFVIPRSVSEGRGSNRAANYARELLRRAGVPLGGQTDASTDTRGTGRRTGTATELAQTRAARREDLLANRRAAAIERRERQTMELRRLMGG